MRQSRAPLPHPQIGLLGRGRGGGRGRAPFVAIHRSSISVLISKTNPPVVLVGSFSRRSSSSSGLFLRSTTEGKKHVSSTFLIISFFGGREGITLLVRRILFETNNDRKRLLLLFLQKNRTWKWKTEDSFPSGLPIPDETNRRRSRKGIHSTVQFDLFNRPREWHVADTYRFSSYLSTFLSFLYYRTIRIVRCRLAVVDDGGWIE